MADECEEWRPFDLEDNLHLDWRIARQSRHAHGRTRVFAGFAKHFDHEIGEAIDDRRLIAEPVSGVHHPEDLDDALDAIERGRARPARWPATAGPHGGPVLSENSIKPSRGSMIVAEESSKSLAAMDGAVSTRWCEAFWRNQPIVKTLVIPFPVTMRRECGERSAQVSFAEDDDPVQAPLFNRLHAAPRVRVPRATRPSNACRTFAGAALLPERLTRSTR